MILTANIIYLNSINHLIFVMKCVLFEVRTESFKYSHELWLQRVKKINRASYIRIQNNRHYYSFVYSRLYVLTEDKERRSRFVSSPASRSGGTKLNLGPQTRYPEGYRFHDCPHSLQENAGVAGHDRFLPHSYNSLIKPIIGHVSVVKQYTNKMKHTQEYRFVTF
jgi:hypothetical protein